MGTGGPFPGGKARPGRDADHSPPSSAEVENEELYLLSPQAPPWRVAGLLYLYCHKIIAVFAVIITIAQLTGYLSMSEDQSWTPRLIT